MNTDSMTRLLAEILDSQIETGAHGEINDIRMREALTTGPDLTKQEQSLLLLSPVARGDFQRMRNKIVSEIRDRVSVYGVETELLPLAAASSGDKITLKNTGFSVTLYCKDDLGIPWVILVQLGNNYQQAINPMTTLKLVDTGGLEWMRGKPDAFGEMTGAWYDFETDLLSRARRFSLVLEPV